ncbi:unnamed protein product [Staurois parvus]|uniref:Uncharacterized protein n=1 Tax=Staurois parvus TaxID=386267 RepID=A0ABN9GC65_9NEOB|nr:unnamed protein product [Staurois parvus]
MDIKGKKNNVGFPLKSIPDPYPSMQPSRSGKGGGDQRAPPPPPPESYQATCPQHGGVLWGRGLNPQSTLSPC